MRKFKGGEANPLAGRAISREFSLWSQEKSAIASTSMTFWVMGCYRGFDRSPRARSVFWRRMRSITFEKQFSWKPT